MASEKPGSRQSAYQVRVASSESRLSRPDVWDSGKVVSGDSSLVPYAGPQLKPRTRYFWSVRVWDGDGEASGWSAPSWWETGLMGVAQWSANWISAPAALTDAPSLEGCDWIWFPEGEPANSAPAATRWFRRTFDLPAGVTAATLALTADNVYSVSVNGTEVARTDLETDHDGWRRPAVVDVLAQVRSGGNVFAVSVTNATVGPAGLVAVLTVRTPAGEQRIVTDTSWKSTDKEPADGWRDADFDDSGWPTAKKAAAWGPGRGAGSSRSCTPPTNCGTSSGCRERRCHAHACTPRPSACTRRTSMAAAWAATSSPPAGPTTASASNTRRTTSQGSCGRAQRHRRLRGAGLVRGQRRHVRAPSVR